MFFQKKQKIFFFVIFFENKFPDEDYIDGRRRDNKCFSGNFFLLNKFPDDNYIDEKREKCSSKINFQTRTRSTANDEIINVFPGIFFYEINFPTITTSTRRQKNVFPNKFPEDNGQRDNKCFYFSKIFFSLSK